MGFASYFEDIQRLRDELVHLGAAVNDASSTGAMSQLRVYQDLCRRLVEQCDLWLGLATDPDIKLADQVIAETRRSNELAAEVAKLRARQDELTKRHSVECERLRRVASAAVEDRDRQATRHAENRQQLESQIAELKRILEFERAARKDFGGIVDRHFPPP